jgi:hypothetical protein
VALPIVAWLSGGISSSAIAKSANAIKPPEIFFLGDSHLSFGAGDVYLDFFRKFEKNCEPYETWSGHARSIAMRRFGLMGVKSTALHTWVSRRQSLRRMVCVPDPKWPVNARLYGFPHRRDGHYVQLGKDSSFPFCHKSSSPLEALLSWSMPRLIVFYFTGNTIDRWANSERTAKRDTERLMQQLPKSTACVFMTTSPVYKRGHNKRRLRAQANIAAAMTQTGSRCQFLPMLTPATIKAIQGKAHYFRRHENGRVKDPYHPGKAAARKLVSLRKGPLCRAVLKAMRPSTYAGIR